LDTGADLPPCPTTKAPHTVDAGYARTVAAVLLAFLDSLPESVVPPSLHQRCCEVTSRDAAFEVSKMYDVDDGDTLIDTRCVPLYFFTRKLVSSSDLSTTASIFAPILLRDDIDLSYLAVQCYQHTRQRQFWAMECTVTQAANFTHLPSLAFLCIVPNGIVRRSTISHFLEHFLGPFEHIFQGLDSEKDLVLGNFSQWSRVFLTLLRPSRKNRHHDASPIKDADD
ncbi:hypothetical protein EDB84DRAFT_1600158, partial [Lactarius hengduanensis]